MDLTDSYIKAFPKKGVRERYDFLETRYAASVMKATSPDEFKELVKVLSEFRLSKSDITTAGGNEGPIAARLNKAFRDLGWREAQFDAHIKGTLNKMPHKGAGEKVATPVETEFTASGYRVDNVKGTIALDVEWNAKDGNLDRDISAYRAYYDLTLITVGVMVTRTLTDLRELGAKHGVPGWLKTTTTTNLPNLRNRMVRGDGGGCPILAIAISDRCFDPTA